MNKSEASNDAEMADDEATEVEDNAQDSDAAEIDVSVQNLIKVEDEDTRPLEDIGEKSPDSKTIEDDVSTQTTANSRDVSKFKFGVFSGRLPNIINRREYVLEVSRNMFLKHKWNNLLQMVEVLHGDTRIPGFVLMHYLLLALHTSTDQLMEKQNQLRKYISMLNKIVEEKYEFLIELCIFLLQQKMPILDKTFVNDFHHAISKRIHYKLIPRKSRFILKQTYLLYDEYLDYMRWKMLSNPSVHSSTIQNEVAILSNKIKNNLQDMIEELNCDELHFDIGILMLMDLCEEENALDDALDCLERYSLRQPNNLNAHIYLYEFLSRYPDIPHNPALKIKSLKNIVRLCPDSKYTIRLASLSSEVSQLQLLDRIELICDFVDYRHNWNSRKAWRLLHKLGSQIHQEHWHTLKIYFDNRLRYWRRIHFVLTPLLQDLDALRQFRNSHQYDSDYSSETSFESKSEHIPSVVQNQHYRLYISKGKFLNHLSHFMELETDLEQYRMAIVSL